MNISDRDRKVLTLGVVSVAAILVVGYGVIPLLRSWTGSADALSSKAAFVKELRERVDSQDALVKQRNALTKRLGSLFEPLAKAEETYKEPAGKPDTPEVEKTDSNEAASEEPKPDEAKPEGTKPEETKPEEPTAEEAKPEEKKDEGKKDEKAGPETVPGATLAAYVEQNAKKVEVTVKSITPSKSASGLKGTKEYRSVLLQVKLEGKAQNFVKLLQALEYGERFVKVEQVQVHRDMKKEELSVTLDVRAYEAAARAS